MKLLPKFLLFTVFTISAVNSKFSATLGHITTKTPPEIQAATVKQLIIRAIPDKADSFFVEVLPKTEDQEYFQLTLNNSIIRITANSGVAAATGFNYYLKYYCGSHISWEVSQLNLPDPLPEVNVRLQLNDKFRYYQNVCTPSYSFVWWTWEQWEKHIDWMALNSFNFVLAFQGQEAIWERVYQKFNLTLTEIDEHFAGPAFLSWLRMGNFRRWGGPLSSSWHTRSLILQKQILQRMRDFGMIPILPAFAGHVPLAFKRLYPDANLVQMGAWGGFSEEYCCPYFLDPTEPLFNEIGTAFLQEQINEFGTDHVYNCDSFNENTPANTDLIYLNYVGRAIYKAMTDVDPEAIWVMQGWLFVSDPYWADTDRAKALLTSVPLGKMIVLDLESERYPQYERLSQFFGQPYIWCMLHNFGGTLGMQGSSSIINEEPTRARNLENSTMIGTGLTMEGINQNYVIYDLMTESAFRTAPVNLTTWAELYAIRRYGFDELIATQFWADLMLSIYDYRGTDNIWGQYSISKTPDLNRASIPWYPPIGFMQQFGQFLNASVTLFSNPGYLHDLVDVTRQVLQLYGDFYGDEMIFAYQSNDLANFRVVAGYFLDIFVDLELILLTNKAFLLGPWIESAKAYSDNPEDELLFEYNARNQITLWGPRGEIMNYANKQWSGIVADFFAPRWSIFVNYLNETLTNGGTYNATFIKEKMFIEAEEPFTFDLRLYPTEPIGDTISVATMIYDKWVSPTSERGKLFLRIAGGK